MRLSLRFPASYPSQAPTFDLDHNAFVSLKTRAFILRALRAIIAECVAQLEGCMKPCARFLAGSREIEVGNDVVLAPQSAPFGEDSDEEEPSTEKGGKIRGQMIRLLPGARCGASFSPSGDLVIFNVVKTPSHSRAQSRLRNVIASMPEPPIMAGGGGGAASNAGTFQPDSTAASVSATGAGARPAGGRFLTSYASITSAMDSLTKMATDAGGEDDQGKGRTPHLEKSAVDKAVQGPELMHLMDARFLARRLQARSDSKKNGDQNSRNGEIDNGGNGAAARAEQPHNSSSSSPQRGRGRQMGSGPSLVPLSSLDASEVHSRVSSRNPSRDMSPLTKRTPRSRSVAIGRDRHNASPLVASGRLVHAHSEVKIYRLDVSALTLRISKRSEEQQAMERERSAAGEVKVVDMASTARSRSQEHKAGDQQEEGDEGDAAGRSRIEVLARPAMGRKRSASSPSTPVRAMQ